MIVDGSDKLNGSIKGGEPIMEGLEVKVGLDDIDGEFAHTVIGNTRLWGNTTIRITAGTTIRLVWIWF